MSGLSVSCLRTEASDHLDRPGLRCLAGRLSAELMCLIASALSSGLASAPTSGLDRLGLRWLALVLAVVLAKLQIPVVFSVLRQAEVQVASAQLMVALSGRRSGHRQAEV